MSWAEFSAVVLSVDVFFDCSEKRMEASLVMEISLFVGRIWRPSAEGPFGSGHLASVLSENGLLC